LLEDVVDDPYGVVVPGPLRDAFELLVAGDLEMLERVRERRELSRRVGLA
jgi:hypothetical protein